MSNFSVVELQRVARSASAGEGSNAKLQLVLRELLDSLENLNQRVQRLEERPRS